MVLIENKRRFSDDEPCPLASKKFAGQLESSIQLPESVSTDPHCNLHHKLFNSGIEGDRWSSKYVDDETVFHSVDLLNVVSRGESRRDGPLDLAGLSAQEASARVCCFSDANGFPIESSSHTVEPDIVQEQRSSPRDVLPMMEESIFPKIDYCYRKPVAIGPNHQADVPSWESQCDALPIYSIESFINHSSFPKEFPSDGEDDLRMGSCLIQMPDAVSDAYSVKTVGYGRVNCTCPDSRSVRCVRQHVAEERDKLKAQLGKDIIAALGFDEMGEDVAGSWSIQEEHLFREVVYSNPLSMGKKFWHELSLAFPMKSKRELVCYYFNVFVLRRRALQNRWLMCNSDSDNDEWQGSFYDETMWEEDDDSVVDSEALGEVGKIANFEGEIQEGRGKDKGKEHDKNDVVDRCSDLDLCLPATACDDGCLDEQFVQDDSCKRG